jgi:phage tail sheath protein FI
LNLTTNGENGALYFPFILETDPLRENQTYPFPCSGAIAGILARIDSQRGVWHAPAGTAATLRGVQGPSVSLTDNDNRQLAQVGVNCLRTFAGIGSVVWGSRTLRGADALGDEYKYVPIRRLALYLEESIYRGTQWAAFEPDDEPLWAQIRQSIEPFMHDLFSAGAFAGSSPQDAYFVRCDPETTTPDDQANGIVNIVVGFAPVHPAEFLLITIQQSAAKTSS